MKETGNLPIGAALDSRAPFNEPLNVQHERFVSVTISFNQKVEGPPDMSEEAIRKEIEDWINTKWNTPKFFDVDELVILKN